MSDESLQQSVQHSFDRDAVRDRVLDLASTCEPEDLYDPANKPKPEVGDASVASLCRRWHLLFGLLHHFGGDVGCQHCQPFDLWLVEAKPFYD